MYSVIKLEVEMDKLLEEINQLIADQLEMRGRPDLFRKPLVAVSSAQDPLYMELKSIIGPWHKLPTELLQDAESIISFFVPFTKAVALEPKDVPNGSFLWSEAYQEINRHFVVMSEALAELLRKRGYSAALIPPTHTYDPMTLQCYWSHRSAGVIAGLGRFGANRLVITEKGSAGRFCSVITSAPLAPNTREAKERCLRHINQSCQRCFDICPVQALGDGTMDKFACQDELNRNEALMKQSSHLETADTCGKCISICPVAYIE